MVSDRVAKRVAEECAIRSALIEAAKGGSIQFTVQLDSAGLVKQIKVSVQVASNGSLKND